MSVCFLAPIVNDYPFFIPGGNTPANGAQLQTFVDGSSTPVTVYKDSAAAVAWSNPILLDSGGSLPLGGEIWIPTGIVIKAILAPANDTFPAGSPYYTWPGLSGMNDVSSSSTDWVAGPTPTFVSATSFTLVGDQRLNFDLGRRIKSTNTGGTVYSTITSVTFVGVTTVSVVNDSGNIDAGLSAVFYSLIDPAFPSIDAYYIDKKAVNIASQGNGTTNIWIAGNFAHITGTNSIFNFSTAPYAGAAADIIFDGALGLSSSSALTLPGNINVTTNPGDSIRVRANTVSTAIVTVYQAAFNPSVLQNSSAVFAGPVSGAAALPSFRQLVGAESAMVLLSAMSFTNTSAVNFGSSQVNFSTFDEYQFHCVAVRPAVNGSVLLSRVSENGGSTFNNSSTVYLNAWRGQASNSTVYIVSSASSGMNLGDTTNGQNNVVTFPGTYLFNAYLPNGSTATKAFSVRSSYRTNVGAPDLVDGSGSYEYGSTSAVSGIQFVYSGGTNISSGTFYCYGVRKS